MPSTLVKLSWLIVLVSHSGLSYCLCYLARVQAVNRLNSCEEECKHIIIKPSTVVEFFYVYVFEIELPRKGH